MKILYVQPGPGVGGSKISLVQILQCSPQGQASFVALSSPCDPGYHAKISKLVNKVFYLDLPTWNKYHRSSFLEKIKTPLSHARRLTNLIPAAHELVEIIRTEQIDLVHTNNGMSAAGAFAARFSHIPHVWHVREPVGTEGQYPLIVGDRLASRLFKSLSRVILCNSEFTAGFFRQRGIPVRVISNGLNVQDFQSDEAVANGLRLRHALLGETDGLLVGMSGNLTTRWKEHNLFLELAARLVSAFPHCRFVVFGGSSDLDQTHYTRELKARSERLGLQDRLLWADFVENIPAVLNCLDILVHPTSMEGSGRVVMEAMAAGKPVVGVLSGGVQELIQDSITGFLTPPGDPQAISEKIRFLLEHPSERESMGIRAAQFARLNFSNESMQGSIQVIYKELLPGSNE